MGTVRHYLPLIGFVVPTAVIGFGFVIPRSCIAGVNELSVGFASTILGAALTYVAGIRSATQAAAPTCTAPPWHVRLARFVNRQAASPSGAFGRFLGIVWSFEHRAINRKTLELLAVEAHHDVLEIGRGPGNALRDVAAIAQQGSVVGIDVSGTMVAAAMRRNRRAIERGRVCIRLGDGASLDVKPASLDRAFAVHSLYFWKEPQRMLEQIADTLRSGGRLVLAFRPNDASIPARFRDPTYRFYAAAELTTMLERAGFVDIAEHAAESAPITWLVAHRSRRVGAKN